MTAVQRDPAAPRCLPQPEFPYPLGHVKAGTVRWSCPARCGWHHDEMPGLESAGPIVLPVSYTETVGMTLGEVLAACDPADIDQAITASATAREAARAARVRAALEEHERSAHFDHARGGDSDARPGTPLSANGAPPGSPPSAGHRCAGGEL